jgi:hypothetical protein
MPCQVVHGAVLKCLFGLAPSTLVVTPEKNVLSGGPPAANIMDFVPMKNIMPFGMCNTPTNPAVASATAAASGVLTPMPCVPVTTPWKPGATNVVLGYTPALDDISTCQCAYGGVITVAFAGQTTEMIP